MGPFVGAGSNEVDGDQDAFHAVLGPASPAFTMSVYQHVLDGMTAQAADALEVAFVEARGAAR